MTLLQKPADWRVFVGPDSATLWTATFCYALKGMQTTASAFGGAGQIRLGLR
jgi:hypothetical protein